jgi:hypothetical protein
VRDLRRERAGTYGLADSRRATSERIVPRNPTLSGPLLASKAASLRREPGFELVEVAMLKPMEILDDALYFVYRGAAG